MRRKPPRKYWSAYQGLYGDQIELPATTPLVYGGSCSTEKSIKPNRDCKTEVEEQIVAATWLVKNQVLFYHVPNGGYRNMLEAVKLKRMGVQAGVPDICIPIARKGFHGLYIELKRVSKGSVSDSQLYWLDQLRKQGYDCFVAKGADALIEYVKKYLGAKNEQGS